MATRPRGRICRRLLPVVEKFSCLCFPAFQHHLTSTAEGGEGEQSSDPGGPGLADQALVPAADDASERQHQPTQEVPEDASGPGASSQAGGQTSATSLQTVLNKFELNGLSQEVSEFLLKGWRESTRNQYDCSLKKWVVFCEGKNISVFDPKIGDVLDFLLQNFKGHNYSYSTLNSIRSALSTSINVDGKPVGQHPLVMRFMRACYNDKPALPKNSVTWDADIVLSYLRTLSPVNKLSLQLLSHKLTMLLVLLSGQRGQTIHLLNVKNMTLTKSHVTFRIGDPVKQSRPGIHVHELAFKAYAPDRRLCVITVLTEYIERTKETRCEITQLLLTHRAPVRPASRDTIRRWIRDVMSNAGIDMTIFTPHSTRAASTSKAATKDHPRHGWVESRDHIY